MTAMTTRRDERVVPEPIGKIRLDLPEGRVPARTGESFTYGVLRSDFRREEAAIITTRITDTGMPLMGGGTRPRGAGSIAMTIRQAQWAGAAPIGKIRQA